MPGLEALACPAPPRLVEGGLAGGPADRGGDLPGVVPHGEAQPLAHHLVAHLGPGATDQQHGPSRCQRRGVLAGHEETRELVAQGDDVQVGGRIQRGEPLPGLVGQEAHVGQALGLPDQLGPSGPVADEEEPGVVPLPGEVARRRQEPVEAVGEAEVPRVEDDELLPEAVPSSPVPAGLGVGTDPLAVGPVRDHPDRPAGGRLESPAHRRVEGHHVVGGAQQPSRREAERALDPRAPPQQPERRGDVGVDVLDLADHAGSAQARREADEAGEGRRREADHQVAPRSQQDGEGRRRQEGEGVGQAAERRAPAEARAGQAPDPDAAPDLARRGRRAGARVAPAPGEGRHLEARLHQVLGQVREQLGGGRHVGPEVRVDERDLHGTPRLGGSPRRLEIPPVWVPELRTPCR